MDSSPTGGTYKIEIGARFDEDWSSWFDGFEVTTTGDTTLLRGNVADQAALHGLLAKLRDLAIPLLDVHHLDPPAHPEIGDDGPGPKPSASDTTEPEKEAT